MSSRVPPWRLGLVALGAALAIGALFLDRLGLGQPGSFGLGQLLLVLFGSLLAVVGVLGARTAQLHRATAILLLDTILVLAFLELAAIAVARLGVIPTAAEVLLSRHLQQPYYGSRDWSETYWREAVRAESYRYEPYVGWRHAPFAGRTINVDDRGLRSTPGSECTGGAFTLFAFGGSTMWGWGSPDWGTIAAHLRRGLGRRLDRPVCVVNFGEDAYVSTQELIALVAQLQRGSVPDAVVFYDGVNEILAAFQAGRPAAHLELDRIAARFEERDHPLLRWLAGLRVVSLARRLVSPADAVRNGGVGRPGGERPAGDLAREVVDVYLENQRIAQGLAAQYGFRCFFFWQPSLAIEGKRLTPDESAIRSRLDAPLVRLTEEAYAILARVERESAGLWYIADVFDEVDEQIWIDELGHVTPAGNELVADRILASLDSPPATGRASVAPVSQLP